MPFMRRSDQGKQYDGRSLSENLRDLDQTARSGPRMSAKVIEQVYSEPMWLGLERVPIAILLGRAQLATGLEAPVAASSPVSWVWEGGPRGARLTKIPGLTQGVRYRLTLLIVEGAV